MPGGCARNCCRRLANRIVSWGARRRMANGTCWTSSPRAADEPASCGAFGTCGAARISLAWSPATCYRFCVQNTPVKLHDVVALLNDQPAHRLVAGQVGTVVEVHAPGVFEVEFLDAEGRTVALAEFPREQLLVLKHESPVAA